MSVGDRGPEARPHLLHFPPEGEPRSWPLSHPLAIGRSEGDIVLPDDEYLSGSHLTVDMAEDDVVLHDQGSTNGTFVRVNGEIELEPGDEILVGEQVFRLVT